MPPDNSVSTRPAVPTGKPFGPFSLLEKRKLPSGRISIWNRVSGPSRFTFFHDVLSMINRPNRFSNSTEVSGTAFSARFTRTQNVLPGANSCFANSITRSSSFAISSARESNVNRRWGRGSVTASHAIPNTSLNPFTQSSTCSSVASSGTDTRKNPGFSSSVHFNPIARSFWRIFARNCRRNRGWLRPFSANSP